MKASLAAVKEAGLLPRLRLMVKKPGEKKNNKGEYPMIATSTGPHTVKVLLDKEIEKLDSETGKMIPVIRYMVEEKGVLKSYDTPKFNKRTGELSYFVQQMAEIPEGTTVTLEAKKMGLKNYIQIIVKDEVFKADVEDGDDDDDQPDDHDEEGVEDENPIDELPEESNNPVDVQE